MTMLGGNKTKYNNNNNIDWETINDNFTKITEYNNILYTEKRISDNCTK